MRLRVDYISPSSLPSRSANAVHVMMQCMAFARSGADVRLFARRTARSAKEASRAISSQYGMTEGSIDLRTYYSPTPRGSSALIALLAIPQLLFSRRANVILSRNLYASFFLGAILRVPIVFETHQLEIGFRKHLQRWVMRSASVLTIVISQRLLGALAAHHGVSPCNPLVLHDAAPADMAFVARERRRSTLCGFVPAAKGQWRGVCGYFGHLYPGRGIEVIAAMAAARPDILFLVYGGNEADIEDCRSQFCMPNLMLMGFVPHGEARSAMACVDVLLMPYQRQVSIGLKGHDTAAWMSPMKMFEYLASGVPVISSDLPALCEVLRDEFNCLLVPPDDVRNWLVALDRLLDDADFSASIGAHARAECLREFTWEARARKIIAARAAIERRRI